MDDDDASLPSSDSDTPAPDAPTAEAGGTSRIPPRRRCMRAGCTKKRIEYAGSKPFCMAHGGGVPCAAEGCAKLVSHKFCSAHGGHRCKAPGCTKNMVRGGYCRSHCPDTYAADVADNVKRLKAQISFLTAREQRRRDRIRRDRKLRDKYFHRIFKEQGYRCCRAARTCGAVDNGGATRVCPWGDAEPTFYALELEHIVPLWEGGTNDRSNLQVICRCCHGVKTALERPRLEAMRSSKREELGNAKEEYEYDAVEAWLDEFGEDEL